MAENIFERVKNNPILTPNENSWENRAVFNCGTIFHEGKVHMLYRAIGGKNYVSVLGYASSDDGMNFVREYRDPVMKPSMDYEQGGCEDPRIMKIDGEIYLTYVALSSTRKNSIARTVLASTKDFSTFERIGIVTKRGVYNKDVVIFPEKIGGRYVMIHRPTYPTDKYHTEKPSMWLAFSDDLKKWSDDKLLLQPQEKWEWNRIGAGPPPVKVSEGWLQIYHGVDSEKIYRVGALLLDAREPSIILAKTKKPIFEPETNYEKIGDVPNVVFPTGTAEIDDKLYVYYGGADKFVCVAKAEIGKILDSMEEFSKR